MKNKQTSLWYALVCLSVTLPLLSGCRISGPAYKMSSWQFYNPLSKKSKGYDDSALAQQFDESPGLPKRDVVPPSDGYLKDTPRETRASNVASSGSGRSDLMNDLHTAGNTNTFNMNRPDGNSSAKPASTNTMTAQSNIPGTTGNPPLYGTTTPIEPGFASTGAGQYAGTPVYPQPGQQFVGGQPNTQGQVGLSSFPGQPMDMVATAIPGSSTSPQMVASTQGMGYGGQVPDYTGANQTPGYPVQGTMAQGAMPQNTVMPNAVPTGSVQQPVPMPNGQVTSDLGYGINTYTNSQVSGMNNPAAMGVQGYPMNEGYGAMQPSTPFSPGQQPYPVQQTVNSSPQIGFSYFGPTNDDIYRPGGSMY